MLGTWLLAFSAVVVALVIAGSATWLPSNCDTCHLTGDMETQTAQAGHVDVPCSSCHVGEGVVSRLTYSFRDPAHLTAILGLSGRGIAAVDDGSCLNCHELLYDGPVTAQGITVVHETCAAGSTCTDCHSTTAHGEAVRWPRIYSMEQCLSCHSSSMDVSECDTCHAGRRPRDRTAGGTWAVTHGPNWRSTHGMGDPLTCGACHPTDFCGGCHGAGLPHDSGFMSRHARIAQDPEAQCDSCHQRSFCDDCHGVAMPHPEDFARQHAAIIERQGDEDCRRCHGERDCVQCHELHVHPGGSIGILEGPQQP